MDTSDRLKPSLYTTLIITVVMTVTIIMSLNGTYSYFSTKNMIIKEMERNTQQSITSLQKNIANLLEAYAVNEYEELIITELERRETFAIIVEDFNMAKISGTNTYITGKIRDADGHIHDYDVADPEQNKLLQVHFYFAEGDIISAEGEKLGMLRVYASDNHLSRTLNQIIIDTVINSLTIIVLLIFSLLLTIRNFILKPLSRVASIIANSDEEGLPVTTIPDIKTKELAALTGAMNTMVTTIKSSRQQLENQHQLIEVEKNRLQQVIKGAGLGYWDWNYKTNEHIVNDTWLAMLGLNRDDIDNHANDWAARIHPDDRKRMVLTIQSHIKSNTGYTAEFRMRHHDGHWVWIEGSGAVVEYDTETGEPLRLCGTHRDISARKATEDKLKLSSRVFNSTHEGIIITDPKGYIVDVNPAFHKITGYSREEVIGKKPSLLQSGQQTKDFYKTLWHKLHQDQHWHGEIWNHTKQGELYAESLTISSITDDGGKVQYYVGIFSNITDSKKQQERLDRLAHFDELTGLPNRTLFSDRFTQALAHSKRTEKLLAICFLDLDNFKPVNDNYGHSTGDELLIEVSNRIKDVIRGDDTVSRLGGDEFALLLNEISSVTECEHTLHRIINRLSQPYVIDGYPHKITSSIGVTLYPEDDEDIDTLLRHADQAMYQAKIAGKDQFHFFDQEQDKHLTQKQLRLEEIQHALHNGEFTLYYQPKLNMKTGEIFGAEA